MTTTRALFLSLLLANLAYFAWANWLAPGRSAAKAAVAGPAGASIPGIRLVGEPPPPTAPGAAAGSAATGTTAGDSTRSASGTGAGDGVDTGTGDLAGTGSGSGTARGADAGTAAPVQGSEGTAASGAATGAAASSAPATARAGAPAAAAPSPAVAATRCVALGEFTDLDQVAQVIQLLKAAGRQPRQRPADGMVPDGFIVLVDGLSSVREQERVQARLRRGGLDDAIALPRIDDSYSVAVGTFAERRRAERRAAVVTKMGMKPVVTVRERPGTVYWVDVDVASTATQVAESVKAALGAAAGSADWQELPCPAAVPVR